MTFDLLPRVSWPDPFGTRLTSMILQLDRMLPCKLVGCLHAGCLQAECLQPGCLRARNCLHACTRDACVRAVGCLHACTSLPACVQPDACTHARVCLHARSVISSFHPIPLVSFDVDILRIRQARTILSRHRVIALEKTRIHGCGARGDVVEFG